MLNPGRPALEHGVLYTKTGEYSAVLRMENPVQKYSADIDSYYEFTSLLAAIAQTLGEGYAIHKQDVFVRKRFEDGTNERHEYRHAGSPEKRPVLFRRQEVARLPREDT